MIDPAIIKMREHFARLEKRLNEQADRLKQLARRIVLMQRVVDAAKVYVLTPYSDRLEDKLHCDLYAAVHAMIKADAPNPQNGARSTANNDQ